MGKLRIAYSKLILLLSNLFNRPDILMGRLLSSYYICVGHTCMLISLSCMVSIEELNTIYSVLVAIAVIWHIILELASSKEVVKVSKVKDELTEEELGTISNLITDIQDRESLWGHGFGMRFGMSHGVGSNESISLDKLKQLDNKAMEILTKHISEIDEFSGINHKHYFGELKFIADKQKWLKYFDDTGKILGLHYIKCNMSVVRTDGISEDEIFATILHERIHSITRDESLTTYATIYLLWNYYSKTLALSKVSAYLMTYRITEGKDKEYDNCLYYIYKHLDKFK